MSSRFALALAACLTLAAAPVARGATADPVLAETIGSQTVSLPLPDGFVEPEGPASVVTDVLRNALPANYRLIALRVPQDYVDKLRAHDRSASMARYCTFLTYRNYEASGMSPTLFRAIKQALREQSEKVLKTVEAQTASGAERVSKDLAARTGDSTTSLKIGASTSLGIIDEHENSFALATIGPVSISSKDLNENRQQVAVVAVALVHGKPVNANFYADYASTADLVWAEDQARAWLRRLAELNR
jgi:hypothetical protein